MSFKGIEGHETTLRRLWAAARADRLPAALLLYGPPGVGKAAAALEFARALHCERPGEDGACDACASCHASKSGADGDLKILNAQTQAQLLEEDPEKQQHVKIEAVRHLIKDLEMRSFLGRWKIAIIEDAHTMQPAAASSLLKALEEPPPKTLWILVSSYRDRMLPTILSRCRAVAFRPLPDATVVGVLRARGVAPDEAARLARLSEGSPGVALRLNEEALPAPETWAGEPLAPFQLSESLPRELHLARPLVADHLRLMSWHLRGSGARAFASPRRRRAFGRLAELQAALKSNADPKLVLQAAALEVQAALKGPQ